MTGVSECSQQRGNLKDNGYKQNEYLASSLDIYRRSYQSDCCTTSAQGFRS
ncbi:MULTISPECIES: hypothetical protein [Photorhabdus]|uniref:hypothetical protein n=1 Tax=Photorhabdus TaxID=29487 RepID=UPI0003118D65|nr:hypothetical protein [Photorhabdus asymbiotica]